ncbi:MAG TPA: hypothetical protein PKN59_02985, partial [Syntrophales bacterium]|nr:hypothetical protein [Syntrophales bacterium]
MATGAASRNPFFGIGISRCPAQPGDRSERSFEIAGIETLRVDTQTRLQRRSIMNFALTEEQQMVKDQVT